MLHLAGNTIDKSQLGSKIFELTSHAKDNGAHLELLTDFEEYRKTVEKYSEAGGVTAVMDNRVSKIGPENGFWIVATNATGKVIHVQAVRYDYLEGSSLSQQWLSDPLLYAPCWLDIDLDKCDFETAPVSHEVTGGVCYHSDFWLDKKYRNQELASLLSNYAMVLALARFSPEFFYGFMAPRLVRQGWASRAGYLHIHPWAPRWYIRKDDEYYDEYLVWVTGPELADLWSSGKRDTKVLGQVTKNVDSVPPASHAVAGN